MEFNIVLVFRETILDNFGCNQYKDSQWYDLQQLGGAEFRASKENDLNIIQIGNEKYEIPDAVIYEG